MRQINAKNSEHNANKMLKAFYFYAIFPLNYMSRLKLIPYEPYVLRSTNINF